MDPEPLKGLYRMGFERFPPDRTLVTIMAETELGHRKHILYMRSSKMCPVAGIGSLRASSSASTIMREPCAWRRNLIELVLNVRTGPGRGGCLRLSVTLCCKHLSFAFFLMTPYAIVGRRQEKTGAWTSADTCFRKSIQKANTGIDVGMHSGVLARTEGDVGSGDNHYETSTCANLPRFTNQGTVLLCRRARQPVMDCSVGGGGH
jgi:hypothetical protein